MKIKLQPILIASFALTLTACDNAAQPAKQLEAPVAQLHSEAEVVEHTENPGVTYRSIETLRSEVLEIDHATRTVTLAGDEGQPVVFVASEEVRNLAQVSKGDELAVDYIRRVNIALVPSDGKEAIEAAAAEMGGVVRAEGGAMPGAAAVSSMIEIYEVANINQEQNTFTLKDVTGQVNEYVARNPENLTKAKVGDAVVITTEEAFAISLNKLTKE